MRDRFGAAGIDPDQIVCERDTNVFDYAGTPTEFVGLFRHYYGPTMNAFEAAAVDGRNHDLRTEPDALFEAQNTSTTPGHTVIPATFLRVTVTR